MRHAGPDALTRLEPLRSELRTVPQLTERKPGVFYRRSSAALHFHEDPSGLYADVKQGRDWFRLPADTQAERSAVLALARAL